MKEKITILILTEEKIDTIEEGVVVRKPAFAWCEKEARRITRCGKPCVAKKAVVSGQEKCWVEER